MEIYQVGGAVRDKLLGLPVKDRDWVVVGATPQQMKRLGFRQVGREFPVFLHPETLEEYALARTERKRGRGYKGFEVHASPDVTLIEDLQRRDLTINAIAEAPDGTLIDPFDGAGDIQRRVLRHVSPAFAEDPVRVLRVARLAARFAPLGFHVAEQTLALMRGMVEDGEVDALVPERVWQELERALGESSPTEFFRVLHRCGALARVMPELERLFANEAGPSALRALDRAVQLSTKPQVRFAALTRGLGGGGVDTLCERLRAPSAYRDLAALSTRCCPGLAEAPSKDAGGLLDLLEAADAFRRPDRFEDLLLACRAGRDEDGGQPAAWTERLRAALGVARGVETAGLRAQGLSGEGFAAALRRLREAAIGTALQGRGTPKP